jgi:NAD(P)-dependent dehydrogenase (short-subunit alcohol dehydrogenase family)
MPNPNSGLSLDGRIALITGAAGGIGAATARRLAAAGARLVLADLDGGAVEKLAAELDAAAVAADVTRPADIARMVEEPYRRWGRCSTCCSTTRASSAYSPCWRSPRRSGIACST